MKQYRLLFLSLGFLLQAFQCIATEGSHGSPQNLLAEVEIYERGLLERSFQVILRHYKDDWVDIREKTKFFQKDNSVWGYGGWGHWVIDSSKAKDLFHAKALNVKRDFEEIFFDPNKLDTESERLSANILAQASLIWRYYNAQCEQIIVEYPRRNLKDFVDTKSYEDTFEFQLILLLEELMITSQKALIQEIEGLKKTSKFKVSQGFIERLNKDPLKDNFHNIFKTQYMEIKSLGGPEKYLEKLRTQEHERQQRWELKKQERLKDIIQKKLAKIPLPPPVPIQLNTGKKWIIEEKKSKNSVEVKEKSRLENPKITPRKKIESLPQNLIKEIKNPPKLRSVKDRILKDITPQQTTNEYLSFFNQMMQRRQAIEGEEGDQVSEETFGDDFE